MQTLNGRTCVFAGASGGDGVDAVKALCAGGMNVVMMTHQPAQARRLLEEIEGLGLPGRCVAIQDGEAQEPPVSDEEVFRGIAEAFGGIDVVICNTGDDGDEDSIDAVDREALLHAVDHLLGGSYAMLKAALPWLRKSAAPRVIFMTTVEGARGGYLESFANAVAKGAVLSLAKNCAARLAAEGICVNCIAKGAVDRLEPPRGGKPRHKKDLSEMRKRVPMGRPGTPGDLAQAICFLASEEAGYITGTTLDLSGGLQLI